MKKFALLAVLAVVALVGAGQAAGAPSKSHKCQPHKVAYVVHGKLLSGSLTKNSDKTWSGTLTVHVTKTNKHAKSQKGTDQTYNLDHVKGKVGKGEDPSALTPDSRVEVQGKITKLAKKCDQTGFTPTVTVKHFTVKLPKKPKS
jgi:opacity protein-like surface antigen